MKGARSNSVVSSAAASSSTSVIVRKKYESCKNFREKGECKYGDRCLFAHGDHELTKRGGAGPFQDEAKENTEKKEEAPVETSKVVESTKDSTKIELQISSTLSAIDMSAEKPELTSSQSQI